MGRDIHIGRANDWTEAKSAPIRLEEWLALVQSDPEMRLDAFAAAKTPDGILRHENQGLGAWKAYSGNGVWLGSTTGWLHYRHKILTKKSFRRCSKSPRAFAPR
jgi:hypothetical protein